MSEQTVLVMECPEGDAVIGGIRFSANMHTTLTVVIGADQSAFRADECEPDWQAVVAALQAGVLVFRNADASAVQLLRALI